MKVNFGIIGCGTIAAFHAKAIESIHDAQILGVFDANKSGAEAFGAEHNARVFDTLEDLLRCPDISAVSICTPSGMHTRQGILAMEPGKHVVVEKPMSLTLEDADRLIETAAQTGLKTCVISQFRFSEAAQEVKRAVDAGAFGKIVSGSLSMKYFRSHEYFNSGAWRGTWELDGGGALMNQGIHGIDVFRFLMGKVKSLTAITRTLTRNVEVEDSAVAVLEFASGALGTIEGSTTCYPGYPRRIELCGDKGSIILEEDSILRWDLPIEPQIPVGSRAKNVASSDPKAISASGHMLQIGNLVDSILLDIPLLADVKSGRLPLEVILAIYESSKNGKSVQLNS